jgi:hypothetical protein
MATYIGYYRPNESFARENDERARAGDAGPSPVMRQKVIELRDKLPASLKLIGSYTPLGGGSDTRPGVWIVETDDAAELQFVNNWYSGFLEFEWSPAVPVGTTSQATTAALDATQARR